MGSVLRHHAHQTVTNLKNELSAQLRPLGTQRDPAEFVAYALTRGTFIEDN